MLKKGEFPKRISEEITIQNKNYVLSSQLSFYHKEFEDKLKTLKGYDIDFTSNVPKINIYDLFSVCTELKLQLNDNDKLTILKLHQQFRKKSNPVLSQNLSGPYLDDLNSILNNVAVTINSTLKSKNLSLDQKYKGGNKNSTIGERLNNVNTNDNSDVNSNDNSNVNTNDNLELNANVDSKSSNIEIQKNSENKISQIEDALDTVDEIQYAIKFLLDQIETEKEKIDRINSCETDLKNYYEYEPEEILELYDEERLKEEIYNDIIEEVRKMKSNKQLYQNLKKELENQNIEILDYSDPKGVIYDLNDEDITNNLYEPIDDIHNQISNLVKNLDDVVSKIDTLKFTYKPTPKINNNYVDSISENKEDKINIYLILGGIILVIIIIIFIIFGVENNHYNKQIEEYEKRKDKSKEIIKTESKHETKKEITEFKRSNKPTMGVDIFGDLEVDV